ncbi:MAG: hypothetical protein HOU81_18510 [Hamadaea sp.]|uniref:hypothetical protein n=1 Tax=Hamadaea sp. TaxID=2024425 RepID=UPI0017F7D831|nr:hypothetical protein [Hamadaea sp.]NUR72810.1 hypothetical protein [Hamadaea sp.]NUT20475.1 hypothetical protein [Hamadaea sp.]
MPQEDPGQVIVEAMAAAFLGLSGLFGVLRRRIMRRRQIGQLTPSEAVKRS